MTTDQIAAAVQAGQADRLELWEAVRRFAYGRAYRWIRATEGRGGVTVEDFMQCAFLALVAALEAWDPAAEASFVDVEERDRRDRLHRDMCAALGTLTGEQRAAVVGYFLRGQRTDAKARSAGLRGLRSPAVSRTLRAYL